MDKKLSWINELSLIPPKIIEMQFELLKLYKFYKDLENSNTGNFHTDSKKSSTKRCMTTTPHAHNDPGGHCTLRLLYIVRGTDLNQDIRILISRVLH